MKTEVKAAVAERKIVGWRNRNSGSLVFYAKDDIGDRTGEFVVLGDKSTPIGVSTPCDQFWFNTYRGELDPIYEGDSVTITF